MIGNNKQTTVSSEEVRKFLVDGFLPEVSLEARPEAVTSGFQEFGLPYAADAAITKYLAAFLTDHQDGKNRIEESALDPENPQVNATGVESLKAIRPDVVLFNGGFFDSPLLRQTLVAAITRWFQTEEEPDWKPVVLQNDRLDLAVARGAAYYGRVRRGEGVRIAASLARSYYIGVEKNNEPGDQARHAVCLVPGSAEPGEQFDLDRDFRLTLSQPVEFSLFVSSTRLSDEPGEVYVIDDDQMTRLPAIRTVIKAESRNEKKDVDVRLHVELTEIGTIDLSCREIQTDRRWKLQFDVRSAIQTDVSAHESAGESQGFIDEERWEACFEKISDVFSPEGKDRPSGLMNDLSSVLESDRSQWPMSLLRRIWETLFEFDAGRRKSESHEARWLNLLGYSLRPGYGFAVDDWRVTETWRHVNGKLSFATPNVRTATYILWRRLAGGLSRGQQIAMAEPLMASIRMLHKKLTGGKVKNATLRPEETTEIWRLLGSFELLSLRSKAELGGIIFDILDKPSILKIRDPLIWTLGRLGQRVPLYGPLNTILPVEQVSGWLDRLMVLPEVNKVTELAVVQMSRQTTDRYRDIESTQRQAVSNWLRLHEASDRHRQLVSEGGKLDVEDQGKVFGESLPMGLSLNI